MVQPLEPDKTGSNCSSRNVNLWRLICTPSGVLDDRRQNRVINRGEQFHNVAHLLLARRRVVRELQCRQLEREMKRRGLLPPDEG